MGQWSERLKKTQRLAPLHGMLALSVDTMVEGVHFNAHTSAEDLGYKALAVNLSDMAAMGATPRSAGLALVAPPELLDPARTNWLERFAHGLLSLADAHGVAWRGSEVRHGPLNITVEIDGLVEAKPLRRDAAEPGHRIYVSGTLGDAGGGLHLLSAARPDDTPQKKASADEAALVNRLMRPTPRVALGKVAASFARSAIDLSDGLAADLGHILERSAATARINAASLPLSEPLRRTFAIERAYEFAVSAGDDYELAMTVPAALGGRLENAARDIGCPLTRIGDVLAPDAAHPAGTIVWTHGDRTPWEPKSGYAHFS